MKYAIDASDTIRIGNRKLYRIVLMKNIDSIGRAKSVGGYIQYPENLSQEGDCWVDYGSCAYDNVIVKDNARIINRSMVYGNAFIIGNAVISNSIIFDNAIVQDNASVDSSKVCMSAIIKDYSFIGSKSIIYGNVIVQGESSLYNIIVGGSYIFTDESINGKVANE